MQLTLFQADQELLFLREQFTNFTQSASYSKSTERGYAYDWQLFATWCKEKERDPLPASPETVALYLVSLLSKGQKVTTVRRRNCAIAHYHRLARLLSPVNRDVRDLIRGAQRQRCEQPRQMRPLDVGQLRNISIMLAKEGTRIALRDRAIMVVGFASSLRRSNLVQLTTEDLEFTPQGIIVTVRKEKQDRTGKPRLIGLPPGQNENTCPVRVATQWLEARGTAAGPFFIRLDRKHLHLAMDGECIERVVKKSVKLIGLDPDDRWAAHSLRSGFVTAAGEAGAGELLIAAQTGHKSMHILRKYFRRSDLFKANACGMLDL